MTREFLRRFSKTSTPKRRGMAGRGTACTYISDKDGMQLYGLGRRIIAAGCSVSFRFADSLNGRPAPPGEFRNGGEPAELLMGFASSTSKVGASDPESFAESPNKALCNSRFPPLRVPADAPAPNERPVVPPPPICCIRPGV